MKGACQEQNQGCPFLPNGCFSDVHHLYYPRKAYRTSVERQFRNLPENKEQICAWLHVLEHLDNAPPEKPSRDEMLQAIAEAAVQPLIEADDERI
jgi:hypothetical protein